MLTALVLVCALAVDKPACNEVNADIVMAVPGQYQLPLECFQKGQAFLAESELGRRLDLDHEYPKVVCKKST